MKSDFIIALTQLASERNLPRETVLSAIEAALVSAYRRDSVLGGHNISVKLDPGSGDVSVYIVKTVVDEVADPLLELSLPDAKQIKPDAEVGESIATESLPHSAGRIAAQTAKQVVMQRLREAERELVYDEYADREGEVFSVTIQRIEPKQIIVELGRAESILPASEQVPYERYRVGMRMKVLLQSIRRSTKGPELIVSRTDKQLLIRLFEMEVPEIYNGAVEIMAIAREAGARSKVAVFARQDGVDPVGSCVGLRGIRIQNIVNELDGEKIDVVAWNKDPKVFIANALSPSQVLRVDMDEETGSAAAVVPDRQLSLAIGKEGQNARLAAKLTGWKVDIRSHIDSTAEAKPTPVAAGADALSEKQLAVMAAVGEVCGRSETATASIRAVAEELGVASSTASRQLRSLAADGHLVNAAEGQKGKTAAYTISAPPVDEKAEELPAVAEEVVVEAPKEEPAPEEAVAEKEVAVSEPATEIQEAEAEPAVEVEAEPHVAPEPSAVPAGEAVAAAAPAVGDGVTPEPVVPEALELETQEKKEEEAVPALSVGASLADLPEGIWSLQRGRLEPEPGQIRFAEDIAGLKGGVTARREKRGQRRGVGTGQRKRKSKARRR